MAVIVEVTGSAAEEPSAETVATTPAGVLDPTFELTFDSADQACIYQEGCGVQVVRLYCSS